MELRWEQIGLISAVLGQDERGHVASSNPQFVLQYRESVSDEWKDVPFHYSDSDQPRQLAVTVNES